MSDILGMAKKVVAVFLASVALLVVFWIIGILFVPGTASKPFLTGAGIGIVAFFTGLGPLVKAAFTGLGAFIKSL